ncbi:unnamed protein product [Pseudo-nitzschia multistriata]|uniref:Uncharacterized protein n=1 Tax=Pseudo-nitzschia multistriata TaxID=183589 RepID=A0A448ZSN1_9STRA|nr:unnamed protein product [Pseudo-nitzschia multistriata]
MKEMGRRRGMHRNHPTDSLQSSVEVFGRFCDSAIGDDRWSCVAKAVMATVILAHQIRVTVVRFWDQAIVRVI